MDEKPKPLIPIHHKCMRHARWAGSGSCIDVNAFNFAGGFARVIPRAQGDNPAGGPYWKSLSAFIRV